MSYRLSKTLKTCLGKRRVYNNKASTSSLMSYRITKARHSKYKVSNKYNYVNIVFISVG